ncbi:MAG: MarR family transcriptional regulator [Candidatus Zixiibacteriota bacterium]|nr:MAG: MarR family transcriptional regulator [candidate division Zixibacteria bacterium]
MQRLDPYESLGFHCNLTYKSFVSNLKNKLKGTGVTHVQFLALAHLTALGTMSQSELAGQLFITRATAVRLVDRMERDGWVVRRPDSDDGRVNRLMPTKKAAKAWNDISRAGRSLLNQAYRGVHSSEIETVKRVLEHVRRNLGA